MEKHKVKIIGKKAKLRHRVNPIWLTVEKHYGDYEDNILWAGEIEQPRLEINEKIYIGSETIYRINDLARNIEGGYICWVDDMVEIEDERTIETKIEAETKLKDYECKLQEEKEEKRERDAQQLVDLYKKFDRKWYHFWK